MDDRKSALKQTDCVLMARVSSREQEVEGYSLPAQVRLLKDYCLRKDLNPIKIFEISESASGRKQRELFNEIIAYIAENKIKVLVCEKVDRLTRNFKDAVMIDDWLESNENHQVHLVKNTLVLHKYSRSTEKLNWGLHVLFAKNQIDNLREEVDKGMREKLEQGWLPGKPHTGYKTVGDSGHKIHVQDTTMAPLVKLMFELYDTGEYPLRRLVTAMDEKGLRTHFGRPVIKSQMHRMLSNQFYIGKIPWKGRLYNGNHEPIISLELFESVQRRLVRKTPSKYSKHNPLFKGLMHCAECTGTITWERQKGHWYGHCNHYRPCTQKAYVRSEELEEQLLKEFQSLVSPSPQVIAWVKDELRAKHQADMEMQQNLRKQLEDRSKQLTRRDDILYEDRLDSRISAFQYDQKHQEIVSEQETITNKLGTINNHFLTILEKGINILDLSQNAMEIYKSKGDDERRALLHGLFSNLQLNDKSLEVECTPLVSAIAKKVEKEKELKSIFERAKSDELTEVEFINGTLSPLWLGMRDSNWTSIPIAVPCPYYATITRVH
jgi:site-specific DNA recombinase